MAAASSAARPVTERKDRPAARREDPLAPGRFPAPLRHGRFDPEIFHCQLEIVPLPVGAAAAGADLLVTYREHPERYSGLRSDSGTAVTTSRRSAINLGTAQHDSRLTATISGESSAA
jgi:hypothetical protein